MNLQFERFTLFCRDMAASLRFYRDTLGLVVVEEKTLQGAMAGGLLQLPPCTMRIALLAAASDTAVIVGLFEISDVAIDALDVPTGKPAHGQTALVLSTTDFDALHGALTTGGYRFLTPPLSYPKRVASERSPAGLYREMIVYDPDNVPVSILQIDPLAEEATA
ncbi:VOC family protein [Stenotrophomonas sp. Iso1]|uniref:VOC family protein n=1 Tax=Stenotrophomonas sp. Iso1 TaxID=2977283 RepID=UPI0022B77636|nr:VOC family protein [Stenotrophomonas sp. Iso1]